MSIIKTFFSSCRSCISMTQIHFCASPVLCCKNGQKFVGIDRKYSQISGQNVATALRPFYFAVHPDLFGQHPTERAVNENSLKQLTVFLELIQNNKPTNPTLLKFYIRPSKQNGSQYRLKGNGQLRVVNITLASRDVKTCIQHILKSCDLPTNYVDNLRTVPTTPKPPTMHPTTNGFRWTPPFDYSASDAEERMYRDKTIVTFSSWLEKNAPIAKTKLEATQAIRDETEKLKEKLCNQLKAKSVSWSCGWDISHFKGCLQSLAVLLQHHPEVESNLFGRSIVFGKVTGVSLEGHIILSSGDVRHSWLDLLIRVHEGDDVRKRIPAVEKAVSRVLRDIKVAHRKFQPVVTAQNYETQLRTLSASLADFWVKNGYPTSWPESLSDFHLVVESDASPLMLSPTGQFLVPSSCPSFLIVDFITQNLTEATQRLAFYNRNKRVEEQLHARCMAELGLEQLHKDDNVTPDRMIHCCQQLLENQHQIGQYLKGARIYVTHYYSVLQEGEMCLPWNCTI
ncbi:hypothetical protein CHUAL_003701 [Chamberlinius hualienensis]